MDTSDQYRKRLRLLYRLRDTTLVIWTLFVRSLPLQIADIEAAFIANDASEAGHLAHRLKGISSNLAAHRLYQVARDMETAAGRGALDQSLLRRLQEESESFRRTLAL